MSATPHLSQVSTVSHLDFDQSKASKPLLGKSLTQLTEWVQQQGQPAYRGRQLHSWIYQKGARSFADITVFRNSGVKI